MIKKMIDQPGILSAPEKEKPQLHASMLNMMMKCGVQFQRRFGARFGVWDREEIIAPGIAICVGKSVDAAVNANLNSVVQRQEFLPKDQVLQVAADTFSGLQQTGILFEDEEDPTQAVGEGLDSSVALSGLHYDEIAPQISPAQVQKPFVIEIEGSPFDLGGTIDIDETNGNIRDTKTTKRAYPDNPAESIQMATYSLAKKVETGKLPPKVFIDALIKNKTPKAQIYEATPQEIWIERLKVRIERAFEILEAVRAGHKVFQPAIIDQWWCTKRFCGYAQTCRFWSGR